MQSREYKTYTGADILSFSQEIPEILLNLRAYYALKCRNWTKSSVI
jgi:hypothetical protein